MAKYFMEMDVLFWMVVEHKEYTFMKSVYGFEQQPQHL